jgi:hypothetical protein
MVFTNCGTYYSFTIEGKALVIQEALASTSPTYRLSQGFVSRLFECYRDV